MSPYTADTQILRKVFDESDIWKSLSGPIESITLSDRQNHNEKDNAKYTIAFTLTIKTSDIENSIPGEPPSIEGATKSFEVTSSWEFMSLQTINVKDLDI